VSTHDAYTNLTSEATKKRKAEKQPTLSPTPVEEPSTQPQDIQPPFPPNHLTNPIHSTNQTDILPHKHISSLAIDLPQFLLDLSPGRGVTTHEVDGRTEGVVSELLESGETDAAGCTDCG
jgi:hypothetical protein